MPDEADIAIIGAGAAGLMAAIWAARASRDAGRGARVLVLDGARTLGAKILVSGGGRCNVTHDVVDERAYAGASPPAIRKVLGRFTVPRTIEFFRELGVELKREETGKLFPVTDDAHTVLDALLRACRDAGVEIRHTWRVGAVRATDGGFVIERDPASGAPGAIGARRVILATGGKSLPKTGSDGTGYEIARSLGHTLTPRIFPALVPLVVPADHWIRRLSGITVPARVEVRRGREVLAGFTDSLLCAHFGLSGPAILDASRHYLDAAGTAALVINWLPGCTSEELDAALAAAKGVSVARWLGEAATHPALVPGHGTSGMPDRLARALCSCVGVDPALPVSALTRAARRALVEACTGCEVPIVGDRGWTAAEVTAGGVPLGEVRLESMESRIRSGLHLCGEICGVDGRIGGFNFQWAWASGYTAGCGAAAGVGPR